MKRILTLAILASLAVAAGAVAAEKAVVSPAAEMKWIENPMAKGAKHAVLWGDMATGPYGLIRKIPAGTMLGMHTHTHDQRAIVISGTIVFNMEGGEKKEMGAGSYVFIPGGAPHDASCKAGAECVYLEEGMGAGDFKPVEKK